MLLMVTVAFMVNWIPLVLMKFGFVPNVGTARLLFFLGGMKNPVIYSFTNKQFRGKVNLTNCGV